MINKKNLLRILKDHIDDFKQVLGPQTSAEDLFSKITGRNYLADAIKNHQALLGILLGYGRNNAWLFHQKKTISLKINEFKPPMKKNGSLADRLNEIDQRTGSFSEDEHEYKYVLKSPRIPLPHFMAIPKSLETIKLKEQYGKESVNMKKLFAKQNYVEATLQKLMDE